MSGFDTPESNEVTTASEETTVEETPVEEPVLPEVETNKDEATVTSVVNANIDENTIKDALNEIKSNNNIINEIFIGFYMTIYICSLGMKKDYIY